MLKWGKGQPPIGKHSIHNVTIDNGETVICPVYKKGDTLECTNYHGISLLSSVYKIFSRILFERLLPLAQEIIGKYQAGFMKEKPTIDQIFTLRIALGKCRNYKINTYHLLMMV